MLLCNVLPNEFFSLVLYFLLQIVRSVFRVFVLLARGRLCLKFEAIRLHLFLGVGDDLTPVLILRLLQIFYLYVHFTFRGEERGVVRLPLSQVFPNKLLIAHVAFLLSLELLFSIGASNRRRLNT